MKRRQCKLKEVEGSLRIDQNEDIDKELDRQTQLTLEFLKSPWCRVSGQRAGYGIADRFLGFGFADLLEF